MVTGTHTIHLTGNYIVEVDDMSSEGSYDEDEDDFPDALEEMYGQGSDESDDELDGLENPRVQEVEDDEEAPKLVDTKKGKKRAAEAETLDDLMNKDKTSKKQQKKQKNNKGEAVEAEKESPKDAKKVQFAKNLEQGPTGPAAEKSSGALGVKVVQGVTVDDRKIGSGRVVKKGNKVGVRYIGKLQDGKVFDGKWSACTDSQVDRLLTACLQPTRRASLSSSRLVPARLSRAGTLVSWAWPSVVSVV